MKIDKAISKLRESTYPGIGKYVSNLIQMADDDKTPFPVNDKVHLHAATRALIEAMNEIRQIIIDHGQYYAG